MVSVPHVLSGISIILLVIYGADVITIMSGDGEGFIPLNGHERGIIFGMPPVILSFIAFFIPKRPRFKGLGMMFIVTGILIIIGGLLTLVMASGSENVERMLGEGGILFVVGAIIAALGGIEIKKSTK
ncbi:MAG: hypothetical protein MAG458_01666 [Nitrosopumilus sp.]|nr:hypothetical protein [Nitrosopumilus sp.]